MKVEAKFDRIMYSIEAASVLLSLSRAQIYRLLDMGILKSVQVGKSRRITFRQLEAFVDYLEQFPLGKVTH